MASCIPTTAKSLVLNASQCSHLFKYSLVRLPDPMKVLVMKRKNNPTCPLFTNAFTIFSFVQRINQYKRQRDGCIYFHDKQDYLRTTRRF